MIHHWHCGRKYLWSLRFAATSSCVLCLHTWFSHVFTIATFLNGDVIHLALKFWCRRLGLIPGWCFCSKLRRTVWCLVSAWLPLSTSSNAQRWGLHLTWILSRRHSVWAWPDVTRSVHGWARLGRFVASLTIARGLWLDLPEDSLEKDCAKAQCLVQAPQQNSFAGAWSWAWSTCTTSA